MIRSLIAWCLILVVAGASTAIALDVCHCGNGQDGKHQADHRCCHTAVDRSVKNSCESHASRRLEQAIEPARLEVKLKAASSEAPEYILRFDSDSLYSTLSQSFFPHFGKLPNQVLTPLRL